MTPRPINPRTPRLDLYGRACDAAANSPQADAIERAAAQRLTSGEPLPTAEQWDRWVAGLLTGQQAAEQ